MIRNPRRPSRNFNRFCLVFFIFCFLTSVFCSHSAFADAKKGPVYKFARGLTYLVATPFQFPKEIIQIAAEEESPWIAPWKGFLVGAGSGLYYAGRQGLAGIWDLLTFWTPAGRDWAPLFESSLIPEV